MPGEGEGVGEEVGGCCGCLGSVGWWWLGGVGVMVGEDGGEMMEGVVVEGDGVAGFIGDGVEADGAVEFPVGVVRGAEADFLMGCMGVVEGGVGACLLELASGGVDVVLGDVLGGMGSDFSAGGPLEGFCVGGIF